MGSHGAPAARLAHLNAPERARIARDFLRDARCAAGDRAEVAVPRILDMDTTTPAHASSSFIRHAWHAALIAALPLLCAQAAHAQAVHKCVVDGGIVYQSSPCPAAPSAGVAAAASAPVALAATTNATAPKKKTLAEVLRERDGAAPAAPVKREAEGDGANILRSRMGAV